MGKESVAKPFALILGPWSCRQKVSVSAAKARITRRRGAGLSVWRFVGGCPGFPTSCSGGLAGRRFFQFFVWPHGASLADGTVGGTAGSKKFGDIGGRPRASTWSTNDARGSNERHADTGQDFSRKSTGPGAQATTSGAGGLVPARGNSQTLFGRTKRFGRFFFCSAPGSNSPHGGPAGDQHALAGPEAAGFWGAQHVLGGSGNFRSARHPTERPGFRRACRAILGRNWGDGDQCPVSRRELHDIAPVAAVFHISGFIAGRKPGSAWWRQAGLALRGFVGRGPCAISAIQVGGSPGATNDEPRIR